MALSKSVDQVLRLVEERTGLPVLVEPDASLPANVLAKVTMARGKMPCHQVSYQAHAEEKPDYLIIFQCGFILRRYAIPAEKRFDFTASDTAGATVRQWVRNNPKTPTLPDQNINSLVQFFSSGILSQLRSISVGLRVDSWILHEFPDLATLQQKAMTRQLNDCAAALRPDVQVMMPDQVLAANIAMSTAFALYWAEKLSRPTIALPFQATGYVEAGKTLLDIWKSIPDDPAKDVELIDAWAGQLSLTGWYHWAHQCGLD